MLWIILCAVVCLYLIVSIVFAGLGIHYGFVRSNDTAYFSENGTSARHPFRERIEKIAKSVCELPHEDRYLTSYDGLKLHASLYRVNRAKGLIICVHGFHSRAEKDFASLYYYYIQNGYHVLLVDQRSHMESEGKYAAYGAQERFDLRDWIADCVQLFGRDFPIWLHGQSMGAATCMMVSDMPLYANIRGIIDDSGFDSPISEMKYIYRSNFHFPVYPGVWFIALYCKLVIRMSPYKYSAVKSLQHTTIPCLFIHGDADDMVPLASGLKAYQACASEKELWILPGCGHCAAAWVAGEEYEKRLTDFLKKTAPCA